jgi:hypothetical protein
LLNRLQYAFGIFEHVIVPESNDTIAARFEPAGSLVIPLLVRRVLATIDLDDELRGGAEEIDNVGADRLLSSKTKAIELSASQPHP